VLGQGYGRAPGAGAGSSAGATVIRCRNTGAVVVFGCLALLFVLALAVSEGSQETTGGRIAAAVFFGALALGSLAGLTAGLVREPPGNRPGRDRQPPRGQQADPARSAGGHAGGPGVHVCPARG
jgi:hypothetical protein